MKSLLEKLGQDPKHSLTLFLKGLGFFIVGGLFIGLGYFHHYLWQIPGLILLSIGCLLAAWGYLGIFANRFLTSFNRNKPKNKEF